MNTVQKLPLQLGWLASATLFGCLTITMPSVAATNLQATDDHGHSHASEHDHDNEHDDHEEGHEEGHEEEHDHDDHADEHDEEADHEHSDHEEDDHEEDGHEEHPQEHEHAEEHSDSTRIDADMAVASGIVIATAGPGETGTRVSGYGRVVMPHHQQAHVVARFPGLITRMAVATGDQVKRGDVLAVVEANQSLQRYSITSPIDGVVQQRLASNGEFANDQPLFEIQNTDQLWVEIPVFPAQRGQVMPGQTVSLSRTSGAAAHNLASADGPVIGKVESILPNSNGAPWAIARVVVNNRELPASQQLLPGELLNSEILVSSEQAAVVIDQQALQTLEGNTVVFVQNGDEYQARPVRIGRSLHGQLEVLDGLQAGERYVVNNSFLIKADIGKAGAAHEH
ncbi:efflux RND transporter periplasmic adaptor subunit [Oceanobacter kriegii]|uniref:efflux RND transporter periplasmic adaptor subunit n=1 Tax=Oceanobacter kriegii TaxID=64972 RepID=UPI0004249D16|nr:efflux RND transporter periplasmic adaptor subunit [Oceanobacter kriegii]